MDERCHRSEGMLQHISVRPGCKPQSHGRASGVAGALRTDTPVGIGGEREVSEAGFVSPSHCQRVSI